MNRGFQPQIEQRPELKKKKKKGRESLIPKCIIMKSIGIVPNWTFFWQN